MPAWLKQISRFFSCCNQLELAMQHPQARISFPITIYSHRGGPLELNCQRQRLIENSMQAFLTSSRLRVDLIELDVQLTKDKQVVCYHDRCLSSTGLKYKGHSIHDFDYQALPLLSDGQHIPLLATVFESFPTIPVQVDLKVTTPGLVEATVDLIHRYPGRKERVLIGSFASETNRRIHEAAPHLPIFCSTLRIVTLWVLFKAGLLWLIRIHEAAAIILWQLAPPSSLFTCGSRPVSMLNKGFFNALNKRGVAVIIFGAVVDDAFNSKETFGRIRDSGANAICTDHPSLLKEFLEEEGSLKVLPWLLKDDMQCKR